MDDFAIKVENVSKVFKLPHEKSSSIKSSVVSFYNRKKGYELQHALKDVSFEVKKGEFFGIVGRNGSGKSTLLKLLASIYIPTEGDVHVNGKLTPFIELGVGFNPELTGRENVYLNGALLGFNRKEMQVMYKDIVEFAELQKFMDQKLKNYSSGMQVRLAFSIAIRAESDILLIDEVLAVGDAAFQQKCFNYFRQLKKENSTVVFVSHDMGSIQEFCDRALLINKGNLRFIGNTNEVASRYLLDSAQGSLSKTGEEKTSPNFEFIKVEVSQDIYKPEEKITLTLHYRLKKSFDYDIGISIQKEGVSLHERNTKDIKLPTSAGAYQISISLPASHLLNGLYKINVAAFTAEDFMLIAFLNDANKFYIERKQETLGGLVDMESKWESPKKA